MMKTSSSDENKKCIVHECNNRMWEGEFVGQLCKPCYLTLTTGELVPSTSFVARLFRERDETLKKLEQERDKSATYRVISIGNEFEANYYKIQVEQLLQENIKLNIKLKTSE